MKALNFSIFEKYSAKTPIKHKIFGWGWITSSKNDRLDVMFQDKVRKLLSNQNVHLKQHSSSRKGS